MMRLRLFINHSLTFRVLLAVMATMITVEAADADLSEFERLQTSCLYESKEIFGSKPTSSAYKTDSTLL